ncbi:MAG: hypothetical protein MZU79_01185 [Anaerotruncus sp.]|nr:hypothetical protein [Anaerotruncus sp.]
MVHQGQGMGGASGDRPHRNHRPGVDQAEQGRPIAARASDRRSTSRRSDEWGKRGPE